MNSLKHNIAAMRETKQTPSFVQVLVTFEEAADRIEALEAALREIERACLVPEIQVMVRAALAPEQDKSIDQSSPPKAST